MKNIFSLLLLILHLIPMAMASNHLGENKHSLETKHSYQKLVFYTEFSSEFPQYPNRHNHQHGNVHIYTHKASSRSIRKPLKPVPHSIKNALFSRRTHNPFHSLYPNIYQEQSLKKLQNCPFLGLPFELDNNEMTQEWLVSTSTHLCLNNTKRETDNRAHYWILQRQKNKQDRILAEGDGRIRIDYSQVNHAQHYPEVSTELHLKRSLPNHPLQCGGSIVKWHYKNGRYQLKQRYDHIDECDLRHYPNTHGKVHDTYRKTYQQRVTPQVTEILHRLP